MSFERTLRRVVRVRPLALGGVALVLLASSTAHAVTYATWQDPQHYLTGVSGDATVPQGATTLVTTLPANDANINTDLDAYVRVGFPAGYHPLTQIQTDRPDLVTCKPIPGSSDSQYATRCVAKKQALRLLPSQGVTEVKITVEPGAAKRTVVWKFKH